MSERIPLSTSLNAYQAKLGLEKYLAECGLPRELLELVKLRVSQINGCAFCVDMHWKELRKHEVPEVRLYGLLSWREQPGYSPRERAALAWAEAVTTLSEGQVSDRVYDEVKAELSTREIADLTYAVIAINGWNRLCIAFRTAPGTPLPR
jgi:AhpD family alkylhydroperoxidase